MANYCDYEIHVRGSKKAALLVYATMRCADEKTITREGGTDEEYIIHFGSCCKWEPDAYCDKKWDGKEIDLSALNEQAIRNEIGIEQFEYYPLQDMSAMLHCEIEIYATYEGEDGCSFNHYKDGNMLEEQWAGVDWEASEDDEIEESEEDYFPDEEYEDLSKKFSF